MMAIFQSGQFKLHSGRETDWKIECDNLTDDDWVTLAKIGSRIVGPFSDVIHLGGAAKPFALTLMQFESKEGPLLIVDDVLTTGRSMEIMRTEASVFPHPKGLVAFARGPCPWWVKAIFITPQELDER